MTEPDKINNERILKAKSDLINLGSLISPSYIGMGGATEMIMMEEQKRFRDMMKSIPLTSIVEPSLQSISAVGSMLKEQSEQLGKIMHPTLTTLIASTSPLGNPSVIQDMMRQDYDLMKISTANLAYMNNLPQEPIKIIDTFRDPRDVRIDKIHEELADITKQLKEIKEEVCKPKKQNKKHKLTKTKVVKLDQTIFKLQTEINEFSTYKADLKHLHLKNKHASDTTLD